MWCCRSDIFSQLRQNWISNLEQLVLWDWNLEEVLGRNQRSWLEWGRCDSCGIVLGTVRLSDFQKTSGHMIVLHQPTKCHAFSHRWPFQALQKRANGSHRAKHGPGVAAQVLCKCPDWQWHVLDMWWPETSMRHFSTSLWPEYQWYH